MSGSFFIYKRSDGYIGRGYFPITNRAWDQNRPAEHALNQILSPLGLISPRPAPNDPAHTSMYDLHTGATLVGKPNSALDVIQAESKYSPREAFTDAVRNLYSPYSNPREYAAETLANRPKGVTPGHVKQKYELLDSPSVALNPLKATPVKTPPVVSPRVLGGTATYAGLGGGVLSALAAYAANKASSRKERIKQAIKYGALGLAGGGLAGYAYDAFLLKNK